MTITQQKTWTKIEPNDYEKIGLFSTDSSTCIDAYFNEENVIISYMSYGKNDPSFFEQYKNMIADVNKENELIDGDPDDPNFEDTSVCSFLWTKETKIANYNTLSSISRVLSGKNKYTFMFQMYLQDDETQLYSIQFKLENFDEKDIKNSVVNNKLIAEVIKSIM